ncbi:MAG: hypothetical protein SV186_04165 [Candidatus Nanohaloarchaea archaeon]|nr:hypothetical protein [Candidatus Nanohaloarchaea archaeon]
MAESPRRPRQRVRGNTPTAALLERLLPLAIAVLFTVLYLEFFTHLPGHLHEQLITVQKLLLAYFVVELVVDLGIHRDNHAFIRKRWLDILLVLPFFAVLSTTGRLLRSLKLFKVAKPAKSVKAAKGAKATKVFRAKNISRLSRDGRGVQHGTKP